MTLVELETQLRKRILVGDGGMGTQLIEHGLTKGECPELWNVEKPKVIKKIHSSYLQAGADIFLTNSFGGTRIKLSAFGLEERTDELNFAAAKLAAEARINGKFIAGSIGPTGQFLEPQGSFTESEFIQAFSEQAEALSRGKVDFLLIETMYDLREALCAVKGARKSSDLPVFVTMTFKKTPRGFFTIMGDSVQKCLETLERECNIPVFGANCTLDSKDMADLIKIMRKWTTRPLIAQANSGQPLLSAENQLVYSQSVMDYVRYVPLMIKNGVNIIGGCCGTGPEHIKEIAKIVKPSA
ncbi:MAG: homocysteine S-methyltransferase family protein [Candidatus Aminicenantes bacterium]|nr:homocysteine S-methyltransferase family protein [Candidatus Aminicenantes bacterium]